jgi:ParB-like chromosome segregation protein Spo0J
LACRLLGIEKIPAEVVDDSFDESQKVQQFLVENVARQKLSPVDRALLIVRARRDGEETSAVAERFGVSASTVRRLEAQINKASAGEVAVLQKGRVSLAHHAVIARLVNESEREAAMNALQGVRISSSDLSLLLETLDWPRLSAMRGKRAGDSRRWLLAWACATLAKQPGSTFQERLYRMILLLPAAPPSLASQQGGAA